MNFTDLQFDYDFSSEVFVNRIPNNISLNHFVFFSFDGIEWQPNENLEKLFKACEVDYFVWSW